MVLVTEETAATVRAELRRFDDQECVPVQRDQFVSATPRAGVAAVSTAVVSP